MLIVRYETGKHDIVFMIKFEVQIDKKYPTFLPLN